jgi:hypothetical protein
MQNGSSSWKILAIIIGLNIREERVAAPVLLGVKVRKTCLIKKKKPYEDSYTAQYTLCHGPLNYKDTKP